jgi:predicted metal-dependent phosphoesterase TrpH
MKENLFKAGNTWVRIDLHLHTISDDEFKYKGENFIKDYIEALKTADIRIGAITNHNKFNFEEYIKLKKEAEKNGIWLLPGVELELNEGKGKMHILIIFNDKELDEDNQFITKFIARQFDLHTNEPNKKLEEVLKNLEELKRDYLLIFAHVDNEKGFFKALKPANYINWHIFLHIFGMEVADLHTITLIRRRIWMHD